MRRALLVFLMMAWPAAVRADAIMPFEGECPPGTERGIQNHSEACIPMACEDDGDCGSGASCVTYCVCMADREFTNDGRVVYAEPRIMNVQVGLCRDGRECAEGEATDRRQCEPDDETPAFDSAGHRWTGEPHPNAGCAGCAIPRSRGAVPLSLLGLALLLWRRR